MSRLDACARCLRKSRDRGRSCRKQKRPRRTRDYNGHRLAAIGALCRCTLDDHVTAARVRHEANRVPRSIPNIFGDRIAALGIRKKSNDNPEPIDNCFAPLAFSPDQTLEPESESNLEGGIAALPNRIRAKGLPDDRATRATI